MACDICSAGGAEEHGISTQELFDMHMRVMNNESNVAGLCDSLCPERQDLLTYRYPHDYERISGTIKGRCMEHIASKRGISILIWSWIHAYL